MKKLFRLIKGQYYTFGGDFTENVWTDYAGNKFDMNGEISIVDPITSNLIWESAGKFLSTPPIKPSFTPNTEFLLSEQIEGI